ncbi:MAG: cellulose biosynthesis cyclic di-GMP-binding regulatory protein BcsB [Nevskia sp.]|nr:cellulose biosynthesis cyclic di-GMP-binding regulatory protein BcsB [Nevskia sp.]
MHETTRILTFAELGVGFPMRLTTVFAQASVSVPLRRDQVVTAAKLRIKYAHSPSLVGRFSSLTALVNDEVVGTFLLPPETAAGAERVIDINPALFLEFNQLRFDGVMHYVDYERECEDPTHTTLWSLISNQSTLELTLASLPQPPNLARLPRPFFEPNDPRRLKLPIAFAARPSADAMSAAAIVASGFGALADYRGAEFPASFGVLPSGHAVLLRSGREFEAQLGPAALLPQLRVVVHPTDPGAKLLVLEAPDDAGLIRAAQALVLGMNSFDGPSVPIRELSLPPPPRGTAPRWLDPLQPATLGKLANGPTSVHGLTPGPISYDFRLPPDVWFYGDTGGELDLRYRYAPITAPGATLSTLLNSGFVASTTLARAGQPAQADISIEADRARIALPAGRVTPINQLSFQYQFRRIVAAPCQSFPADSLGGSIDPDSTLRFAKHARYVRWPDLRRFREAGLPFSLQSDLGETVLLLPDAIDEDVLSAALMVAGHFGQVTGASAIRIQVDTVGNGASHSDREVLLIGRQSQLNLPESWLKTLPLVINADSIALKPVAAVNSLEAWASGRDIEGARAYAGKVLAGSSGELGLIIGARSPFGDHSAVWLAAGSKVSLLSVAETLIDPARRQFIEGDVSLLRGTQVSGYLLSDQWGVGHLSWYREFRNWLAKRPWLMTPLALGFAVLATLLIYGSLSRRAARRLKAGGG